MATETLTAPATTWQQNKRRHSTEPAGGLSPFNKTSRRTNSVNIATVQRQHQREQQHQKQQRPQLAPVPEDKPTQAEQNLRRQSRLSRAFSWTTNWNFAGETATSSSALREDTEGPQYSLPAAERRLSTLGRRLSSISTYASSVSTYISTDPSHETNFPKGLSFPAEGGFKVHVSVYGTIDALEATGMRLLMPRGVKQADFTGSKEYVSALEHLCKLKNGDMLCRPTMEVSKMEGADAAIILRGTVQDHVYKCYVVGTFPMKLLFGAVDELPETYNMEAVIF